MNDKQREALDAAEARLDDFHSEPYGNTIIYSGRAGDALESGFISPNGAVAKARE